MNLKKIVAAGIAAVCAVSMAACGGSGSGSSKVTDIQYKDTSSLVRPARTSRPI